ncbi:unnamed protein product [Brachionus calyciflorus]|uniref:Ig-like domain-containing protein n=1 Tax=Brachionus calyciflorus TaxID=104777 RepID=A0A813SKH5_9BILA|nr:unnamed protein product [Brachionus calyciflorus]
MKIQHLFSVTYLSIIPIIIHFLSHHAWAQQSSVQVEKIEMFPVEPRPGESVKIRCYLKNVDPSKRIKPSILWSIRESEAHSWRIIGNGASITDTFNNRLSGRKESDEVYEIVFRPIQETDAGTIKCEITNTEGQIFKLAELRIYSPPYITYITQDVYSQTGKHVVLECHADGYPKPSIKWSRTGEMSAVLYSETFEITSVTREDRGTYRCFAENQTPINKIRQTAEAFVTLTIDFPPTISCDTYTIYQVPNINADAEVTCTVEGYPLNNVRWYYSQRDFNIETEITSDQYHKVETIASPDSIKSVLVIRNVNDEHFGDYSIKVEGGLQQIVEKTIKLEPMVNPEALINTSTNLKFDFILLICLFIYIF